MYTKTIINNGLRALEGVLLVICIVALVYAFSTPMTFASEGGMGQSVSFLEGIRAQVGYMPEAFGVIGTINVAGLIAVRALRKRLRLKRGE